MKRMLCIVVTFCLLHTGYQLNAQTTIIVDGAAKPAVTAQLASNADDIKDALDAYFEKLGSNLRKSNGLHVAKNVLVPKISPEKIDIFFKINQQGNDKNNFSNVSMAVKQTTDVFVGDESHKEIFTLLPSYLQGFDQIVKDFVKQRTIDQLNKDAAKATKEKESLEKRANKKEAKATKLSKQAKNIQ